MNNVFPNEISDIGTDPTTIEVVDTLDFLPLLDEQATVGSSNAEGSIDSLGETPAIMQTGATVPEQNPPAPETPAPGPNAQATNSLLPDPSVQTQNSLMPDPSVQAQNGTMPNNNPPEQNVSLPDPSMQAQNELLVPSPDGDPKTGKKGKKLKKKKSTTPDPDKKPHDTLKKIIFIVIVLGLMGGVGFGLYFYLSLARKNQKVFSLKDVQIYIGDNVSNNINDYGDFSKIDISSCLITGLDSVDAMTPGTYDYSVKCGSTKHSAKIEVLPLVDVDFATKVLYKSVNDLPAIDEFVITNNDYTYLTDEIALKDAIKTNGLYGINISVSHSSGNEKKGYAALYVVDKAPAMNLSCTNKSTQKDGYDYSVTDYFIFDDNRKNLGHSLRLYNYQYNDELEFENVISSASANKAIIENHEGYFIMDTLTKTISIITKLDDEKLKEEYKDKFPETYTAINSYYVNTKNYTCSN